jgi:hypothetical protein
LEHLKGTWDGLFGKWNNLNGGRHKLYDALPNRIQLRILLKKPVARSCIKVMNDEYFCILFLGTLSRMKYEALHKLLSWMLPLGTDIGKGGSNRNARMRSSTCGYHLLVPS